MNIDVYKGNEKAFLILTGIGGSTKGYKDKYVTIANQINKKYGASVFVVAVESGLWDNEKQYFDKIIKEIENTSNSNNIKIKEIYAMGSSGGASLLIHNSHRDKRIKKILAINFIFNVNYNLFYDFTKEYKGKAALIIGEKDDSFKFLEIIKKFKQANFTVKTIPNADHYFTGMLDEFIALPQKFLYN